MLVASRAAITIVKVMSSVCRIAATIATTIPSTSPGALLIALPMMMDPVLTLINIVSPSVRADIVSSPALASFAAMGCMVVECAADLR